MAATYVSPSGTFTFEYPDNWKLERTEGGIVILWKKGGLLKKDSQNTLQIKPLISYSIIPPEKYKTYIENRIKEVTVIERPSTHKMNFYVLKYRQESFKDTLEARTPLIQDVSEMIVNNRIFTCTFTAIKGEEDSPKTREERDTADQILQSLTLL